MWYVYNIEASWECGWSVDSEEEAIRECEADDSLNYKIDRECDAKIKELNEEISRLEKICRMTLRML